MIHFEIIAYGQVKGIQYDGLGYMPRQVRVANHRRYRSWTPAFISYFKGLTAADGESRNDTQVKSTGMIVIDENDDIGFVVGLPLFGKFKTLKHWGPVIVVGGTTINSSAYGRNMRRKNG